jgi:hypothetical protein
MSTPGAARLHAPPAESASPRSAAPESRSPRSDQSEALGGEDHLRPYERPPRGNPPLEQADLERGEEKLGRVLGW